MKVQIKDKDGSICAALRAANLDVSKLGTEMILNVVDFMRENPKGTIKEICKIQLEVEGIVMEEIKSKKQTK